MESIAYKEKFFLFYLFLHNDDGSGDDIERRF